MSSKDFVWDLWPSNIINTGFSDYNLHVSRNAETSLKMFSIHPPTNLLLLVRHYLLMMLFYFSLLKIIMVGTKWPVALQVHKTVIVIPFSPLAMDETQCFPVGNITFAGLCTVVITPVSSQLWIWCGSKWCLLSRISKLSKYVLTASLFRSKTLLTATPCGFLKVNLYFAWGKLSKSSPANLFFPRRGYQFHFFCNIQRLVISLIVNP